MLYEAGSISWVLLSVGMFIYLCIKDEGSSWPN